MGVILFGTERPQAIALLLPQIQQDLGLHMADLEGIVDRFGASGDGELVDLGAEGPAAAARIQVAGAASAVMYVSAAEGAASPTQVRTITEHLLDDL